MTMAIGDTIGNGATQGSVLFVGPSGVLAQNNSNFFWDNTNQRLGIGTTSPSNDLTVRKSIFSGAVRIDCINTNTTGSGANAQVTVSVAGANAGDAIMIYEVSGVMSWIVGLDNSESDKFKIASNILGVVNTRLAVTTDGKVGVNVNDPTAQLHLAAGSATGGTGPLKLTAGTLMSSPEAGAIEWDGTKLWITSGSLRKELTNSSVANVTDFGAIGNGTADDAGAFQAAVDSLETTGGVVWVPPGKNYALGSTVIIKSKYAIWIKSNMTGRLSGGGSSNTWADKGLIRPLNNLTYLFQWDIPAGLTELWEAGGGGMEGLAITDWVMPSTARSKTIDGAVNIEKAAKWHCYDCNFEWLKGRAIKFGATIYSQLRNVKVYACGALGKPPIDIDGGDIMPASKVWQVDDSASSFVDETADFNSTTGGDLQIFPGTEAVGDYFAIGYPRKFGWLTFVNSGGAAGVGGAVAWEFWNGLSSTWQPLPGLTDGTNGFKATSERQHVVFTPPDDDNWVTRSLNGSSLLFYVRAKLTAPYTTNPIYDWGRATSNGLVWWDRGFLENCQYDDIEQVVRIRAACALTASGLYFENSVDKQLDGTTPAEQCPFIDATEGGGMSLDHGAFNNSRQTSIIVGGAGSAVRNSSFANFPGANDGIVILPTAAYTVLQNLQISMAGQTGKVIDCQAIFCQLSDLHITAGGSLSATGSGTQLSNLFINAPTASSGQYAIDLGLYTSLNGGMLNMANVACHSVRLGGSRVVGVMIRGLSQNANGFVCQSPWDTIDSCQVVETVDGGTSVGFTAVAAAKLRNNQGYVEVVTATLPQTWLSQATINSESGVVITDTDLATGVDVEHVIEVTNSLVTTNSRISCAVERGTDTGSDRYTITEVRCLSGAFQCTFKNTGANPINGSVKLKFLVQN